jgi:hypothetical protein
VSDEYCPIDRPHAKAGNILNEELLNLLSLRKVVVHHDRGHLLNAQQAAGERATLALDQQEIPRAVWGLSHCDGRQDTKLFAGEAFVDLADAQRRAETWCRERAGMRIHGTIQARPVEVFRLEELGRLRQAPTDVYDVPIYATAKVHRDHHIEVAKALYSIPGGLIGQRVDVRADRTLVRIYARGQLVKVHPRQTPGRRVTDPADLPAERTVYALRDLDTLRRLAASHGDAVGAYAAALLDHPLPWTKMRHVYALLGLVKKWGPDRVDAACARALDAEAVNVGLIGRMLERATENTEPPCAPATGAVVAGRFARDPSEFATKPAATGTEGGPR